jgi:hypothetical protein
MKTWGCGGIVPCILGGEWSASRPSRFLARKIAPGTHWSVCIILTDNRWVLGVLSLGVKRQGGEADHSPPSSAEVEERLGLYLHSPNTPSWRGTQLKHRDTFTFTFTFCLSHNAVQGVSYTTNNPQNVATGGH